MLQYISGPCSPSLNAWLMKENLSSPRSTSLGFAVSPAHEPLSSCLRQSGASGLFFFHVMRFAVLIPCPIDPQKGSDTFVRPGLRSSLSTLEESAPYRAIGAWQPIGTEFADVASGHLRWCQLFSVAQWLALAFGCVLKKGDRQNGWLPLGFPLRSSQKGSCKKRHTHLLLEVASADGKPAWPSAQAVQIVTSLSHCNHCNPAAGQSSSSNILQQT